MTHSNLSSISACFSSFLKTFPLPLQFVYKVSVIQSECTWTYLIPENWTRDFSITDLWLLVVLHGHGDDVEPDDYGDEQVKVMAGAHLVDEKAGGGVVRVVRLALSFCWKGEVVG